MALDEAALRRLLCERLCADVRLARRSDGALMLSTHFEFPDGDRFPIHVSEAGIGGIRLSDRGHTLMHISYDHKARLTTIMLSHFHRHNLRFESMLVFEDQSEIPRLDLARLSDVGGDMISSLESSADLGRKLLQRIA